MQDLETCSELWEMLRWHGIVSEPFVTQGTETLARIAKLSETLSKHYQDPLIQDIAEIEERLADEVSALEDLVDEAELVAATRLGKLRAAKSLASELRKVLS